MFNRIRQIHLFTAFILATFVLMYFVTGLVMIFENTFARKDNSIASMVKEVPGIHSLRGDTLIGALKESLQVSGQYRIQKDNGRTIVNFRHPGKESQVIMHSRSDSVHMTVKDKNFVNVLHQFHRLHGYYGGWNYHVWALVFDLCAVSMILFAVSGVYLWYKTERVKWPGWLILVGFTALVTYTLIYLAYIE